MTLQRSAGNTAVARALIQRTVAKSAEAFTRDEFGCFDHSFRWDCTAPHTDGYIVQKIERVEIVGDDTARTTYWEAWKVAGGRVYGGDGQELSAGAHDSWVNKKKSYGKTGSWSMTGTVYWVAGDDLPGSFENEAVEMAGGLLSTDTDPKLPADALLFTHSKASAWDATTVKAAKELLEAWSDTVDEADASGDLQEEGRFTEAIANQAVLEYYEKH